MSKDKCKDKCKCKKKPVCDLYWYKDWSSLFPCHSDHHNKRKSCGCRK